MQLHREEKKEEGDRGDQEEKRGNQKEMFYDWCGMDGEVLRLL